MTIMTSYHPSVQLLYLCSAAYWLFQEAPLGVVVQAWTIYWRLWTTPLPPHLHLSLPRSFQTIFDFVSLHMWIILSLYATPSHECRMVHGLLQLFSLCVQYQEPTFILFSFLTHQEQDCGVRERMNAITWTLDISAERIVFWLTCFFFPAIFFLWWNAVECCRHEDIIITSWALALLVIDKGCI